MPEDLLKARSDNPSLKKWTHLTVTPSLKNLEGVACEVIQGDICDNQIVKEITRDADFIFHLAARGSVPRSIPGPISTT